MNLVAALAITTLALAWPLDAAAPVKEKTIVGEAACAKCLLKENGVKECQLAVITEEADKKLTYHVTKNEVAKKFGHPVCEKRRKVTVTGEVKEMNGEREIIPSKIELVKETELPKPPTLN
jgi:hypothetical protein